MASYRDFLHVLSQSGFWLCLMREVKMVNSQKLKLHLGEMSADQLRHATAGFNLAKYENAKLESASRELAAWFTSGNSIPVDLRHTVKVNGNRIMADVERLNRALEQANDS